MGKEEGRVVALWPGRCYTTVTLGVYPHLFFRFLSPRSCGFEGAQMGRFQLLTRRWLKEQVAMAW